MLIGLGGGAASSVGSGGSSADLDFASVQRGNPEIQRRAQEVIDHCWSLGSRNPIVLIHDVGAGGLANAVPEAVAHSARGARIDLRAIPERGSRHVAARAVVQRGAGALRARHRGAGSLAGFAAIAAARALPLCGDRRDRRLRSAARRAIRCSATDPVDMPLEVLLGKPPRLTRDVKSRSTRPPHFDIAAHRSARRLPIACCASRRSPTRPS